MLGKFNQKILLQIALCLRIKQTITSRILD